MLSHKRRMFKLGFLGWWLPPIAFLLVFFFYPLGSIFYLSARQLVVSGWGNITWSDIWQPLQFTLWQAFLSTILTLLVGLPAAYVTARYQFSGKRFFVILLTIPFVLPTVVAAAGYNALLGPRGWLNILLEYLHLPLISLVNSLGIILLAHVFYNTTIVVMVVGNAWSRLDPRVEEASRLLGASPLQVLWEITLPLLRPSILAATLLVFLFDFTSFGVVLLLGGPQFATLEVEIYIQAMHLLNLPLSGLLSAVQLIFTLALAMLYTHHNRKSILALNPRVRGEGLRRPSSWKEKIFLLLVVVVVLAIITSPLLALSARSFVRLDADRGQRDSEAAGFTWEYYIELFNNQTDSLFYVPPLAAIRNSLIYALMTITLAVPFGLMTALAMKSHNLVSRLLDIALLLPLGTSAVTLGLGYVIAFYQPPFNFAGFPYLAPLAHSLVAFPFVVRTLQPVLASIPPTYHHAAATLGAAPARVWWEIDLPIAARSIFISAIFAFTISMGEFGATLLLARPEYPTIPVAIYRYLSQPGASNYGQALAMANLLMIISALSMFFMEKFNFEP